MQLFAILRRRPWITDVLAGLLVTLVAASGALTGAGAQHHVPLAADLATAAIAGFAVGFGRTAPIPVLVVSAAVEVGYLAAGWTIPPLIFAVGWALYQVTLRYDRRLAWPVSLGCALMLWAVAALSNPADGWWTPIVLTCFTLTGMATAAGEAVRSRRAYIAEVEDRARRAEQSREEEVHRRITEERLRIARELHDVVAHHIAVINVQSGAAVFALSRQPEAAGPPMAHIRRASTIVLRELTSIVGLLRLPDEGPPGNEPQPGLDQLPALLEGFTGVVFGQTGEPLPLSAGTDLAAYRIVQEALTNARKHGTPDTAVSVDLTWSQDHLVIEVANPVTGPATPGSGFGLIGMRERAAAAGGMIQAGLTADDNRFLVRGTLPLSGEEPL